MKKKSESLEGWQKTKFDFKYRKHLGENYDEAEDRMRRWMFRDETKIDGKGWKGEKKELDEKMKATVEKMKKVFPVAAVTAVLLYNKHEEDRVARIQRERQAREQQRIQLGVRDGITDYETKKSFETEPVVNLVLCLIIGDIVQSLLSLSIWFASSKRLLWRVFIDTVYHV